MNEANVEVTSQETSKLDVALAEANRIVEVIKQIQESKKNLYNKWLKENEHKCLDVIKVYSLLKNGGVQGLPEKLAKYDIEWGFKVEVKDLTDFALIKRLIGNLEHSRKEPVGDGRKQKIRVYLYPKEYQNLRFNGIEFYYERKLTSKDKCKVVTEKSTRTVVVCKI